MHDDPSPPAPPSPPAAVTAPGPGAGDAADPPRLAPPRALMLAHRLSPLQWFENCGRFRDEKTRRLTRAPANVLQRRVFEHYRKCQAAGQPCRIVVLKYRRAGSSTAAACLTYLHAMNYDARLGVIGTNYRVSANMLEMVRCFAEHDDFPGWTLPENPARPAAGAEAPAADGFCSLPWEERIEKEIATGLNFATGSRLELYTAGNPESARSAGLNGYHATECGRWQSGGVHDAAETLMAMRNALPKRGFHFALEESTAHGLDSVFYLTCRTARWAGEPWTDQFSSQWPLAEAGFERELQFVFIFAAWFEDERHLPSSPLTPAGEEHLRRTLDEDERALIARFGQEGPRGRRLGAEVNATLWEQLAWRRGIIATVCTRGGVEEFKQEYPSSPAEAFRSTGSPALDQEGLLALEAAARQAAPPETGCLAAGQWSARPEAQADWRLWEHPVAGCKYLVTCDPMSGAEAVHGTGKKDRHAVFVLRDAYTDRNRKYHRVKLVARLKPPCQWEDELIAGALDSVSRYYGGATIVVENNIGTAILKSLHNHYNAPLFLREVFDTTAQDVTEKLGWRTDAASRRVAISALQTAIRERSIEILCPHCLGELAGLIIDASGKAVAGGGGHDDDALALAIGLACLHAATPFHPPSTPIRREAPDAHLWKEF